LQVTLVVIVDPDSSTQLRAPDSGNVFMVNECSNSHCPVTNFQGHSFKISVTHPLPSIIYFPST